MDSLCMKSATDLADLIRKKETSSKEVVEAHLKRIEEVNPEINAITLTLEESATELAEKADNASDEERNRPFHGVPITIKENSIIAAGSVITKDIPAKSLGIERSQQKNIDGYMDRKKSSKDKK